MTELSVQPVGDAGLILRFGDRIDPEIHARVLAMEHAITRAAPEGMTELIPSYAALYVGYDVLRTDYATMRSAVMEIKPRPQSKQADTSTVWEVPVCYDSAFAPDLEGVAEQTGLDTEAVINAHVEGDYRVYMYGFAPGYAYLGGTPEVLQLPRKPKPVRDIPAGSVMIAGPQSLVTTLTMPTGWWVIGRSPFRFLRPEAENAFPVLVGDRVRFKRISSEEYEEQVGGK